VRTWLGSVPPPGGGGDEGEEHYKSQVFENKVLEKCT